VRAFPRDVRRRIGGALWEAQLGGKVGYAKPLRGFKGAGVLEVVDDFAGDTYRAVYTVRFAKAVYVLHAFQRGRSAASLHQKPTWIASLSGSTTQERTMNNG
jgi:phage-related protein